MAGNTGCLVCCRKNITKQVKEKLEIQRPGEGLVSPQAFAQRRMQKVKGRTRSSNSPNMYKSSDM